MTTRLCGFLSFFCTNRGFLGRMKLRGDIEDPSLHGDIENPSLRGIVFSYPEIEYD